jgi:hypothetical protein
MRKSLFVLVLAIVLASCAFAQAGAGLGSISGVVQDASGAAVPGATVVVTNESKGIRRNLETTGQGQFTAPALVPDSGYRVLVSKPGFSNYEATNITVAVGQNVDLHVALGVAATTTTVDVTAAAVAVDDTKTDVSQVVGSRQILDLPINGRRVDNFALLTPGVTSDGPFGLISFRGNAGGNTFLTDGNDTTNQFYNENAGRTRTTNIAQDAVQEFQVVTSNFLAEYGRASGGVINTVTRSGSNDPHGTLYWFFRNRTLNATDITANGINPPEWRHQAGASIGGPIRKDKLFYFFNGELQRRFNPLVSSNTLTAASGSGPFDSSLNLKPSACAAVSGVTPSAAQCSAAAAYLVGRIRPQLVPRTSDVNLLFGKIDYRPNDRNSISLSVNYLDFRSPNGIQTQLSLAAGDAIGNNADTNVFNRTARAEWTWVATPSAVNSFRFGFFKDRQYDPASPSLLPSVGPIALSVTNVGSNLAYANGYPRLNPSENRFQIADTYSWNIGPHALKFGFDYATVEDYVDRLANRYGSYSYPSFAAFALDFSGNTAGLKSYSSFSQAFGNPKVDTRLNEIAFFVQDQWHVTPKLIVSPGLRYELTALPQPKLSNPTWPQTAVIPETRKNFGPRIGIAYTINDKTVIRAGYGLFFNRYTSSTVENAFITNGVYQATYSLNSAATIGAGGPVFPNFLAAQPNVTGSASVLFLDKTWRNPYSQQGTLAVERQVAKDTSLTVSYVWSLGLHLLQTRDVNAAAPTTSYTFPILDSSNNQVGSYTTPIYTQRINPAFGGIYQLESAGKSYYDGLLVQLTRRYSNWLFGNVAYTWSHSIDNNQGGGGNTLFGSTFATSVFNGDYNGEKGNSSSDQRHRLVVNAVIAPTFTHNTDWASRYLINGWQYSFVTVAASSFGISPTISVRDRPFPAGATTAISTLSTFSLNGLGGSSRVPFEDPAFLKLGNIYRTDMRLQKQLPISERVKVNLFFEAFNVFNHVQVAGSGARVAQQFTAIRQTSGPLNGLTALVPFANYGVIQATQAPPDGTTARRAQVGVRIVF